MNKAIHLVFIPQILWSALIFLGYLNLPGFTYVDVGPGLTFRPSVGMLLAFAFQFYYIFLDEFVGVSVCGGAAACSSGWSPLQPMCRMGQAMLSCTLDKAEVPGQASKQGAS